MVKKNKVWELLDQISDPEIPVLTIRDLGILRDVEIAEEKVVVTITPTYSGCPAMTTIEDDISALFIKEGIQDFDINLVLSPAWTTDWMSEEGRVKLREYGIAPPENEIDKSVLFAEPPVISCPKCNSEDTRMVSQFGSTACKAHYQCNKCLEPFDYFKCLK